MIRNEVYRLKKAAEVAQGMPLPAGQELEIVTGTRRKKVYNVSYEKAKQLIETQEI